MPLVHTRTAGLGEYNFGAYSDPAVDALIDKGSLEFDPGRRLALFTEAMAMIEGDAAFVPLLARDVTWAMRGNVRVVVRPNDVLDLKRVNME